MITEIDRFPYPDFFTKGKPTSDNLIQLCEDVKTFELDKVCVILREEDLEVF